MVMLARGLSCCWPHQSHEFEHCARRDKWRVGIDSKSCAAKGCENGAGGAGLPAIFMTVRGLAQLPVGTSLNGMPLSARGS